MKKTSPRGMNVVFNRYSGLQAGPNKWCVPGPVRFISIFLPFGKACGRKIRCCQRFAVDYEGFTPWRLDSCARGLLQQWGNSFCFFFIPKASGFFSGKFQRPGKSGRPRNTSPGFWRSATNLPYWGEWLPVPVQNLPV